MTSKRDGSESGGHNSGEDGRLDWATESLVDIREESGEGCCVVTSEGPPCPTNCEEGSNQAGA